MATVQDIRDLLNALQVVAILADSRLDQLGAMVAQLKAGGLVGQADLDEFSNGIQQVTQVLNAIVAKQDTLLAS
jgi:hypothetical protein